MLRVGRVTLLGALAVLLLATSIGAGAGAASPGSGSGEMWWLGPYFAGMRVTHAPDDPWDNHYAYGDCELPEGEGGCSPPAQVQTWSSCTRNPIGLDRLPYEVYLLRGGGLAAAYEPTAVDVGTGHQTVTLFTNEFALVGVALREIRLPSQPTPGPLAPPVYPMPVLRELKRVTAVEDRYDSTREIAEATELAPVEVRLRLRIAELLGPEALAGVPAPTMSIATVERLRQLSFKAQYDPSRTARELGISVASLKKKVRRVRGLAGNC
ncbi:MAG TPA: hypothetical protein VD761_06000 [Solirubrobacterales bacterium]|nr:hypothetical protein [Solirubrobacterales bacterium]